MKKILFVCLLSLSLFVSAAEEGGAVAPDYQLHDIWVLTHVDNIELDRSIFEGSRLGAPRFEFFMDDMRLLGHTACNQFSTSFAIIESGVLEIENAISTKMMCPHMEIENLLQQDYFGQPVNYKIENLQLTLSNEMGGSVSFKKID